MKISQIILIFLLLSNSAHAEIIGIKCEYSNYGLVDYSSLYSPVPTDVDKVAFRDLLDFKLPSWDILPPTEWVIDTENKSIKPGKDGAYWNFENASMSEVAFGGTINSTSRLDRAYITKLSISRKVGTLRITKILDDKTISEWKKLHGASLPEVRSHEMSCIDVKNRRF